MKTSIFLIIASILAPKTTLAGTFEGVVAALDGKTCHVQIRTPENAKDLPIFLVENGTGIYSMSDHVPVPAQYLLDEDKNVAVLSFDKPGISYVDGKVKIDDNVFNSHTQRDLVECAKNSLNWAFEQNGVRKNADIYLYGHSEGAQVLSRLLSELVSVSSPIVQQIKLISLSGIPMDDWKTILNSQLSGSDRDQFWEAINNKDNGYLRKIAALGFNYFEDIFKTEALRITLENLAIKSPKVRFQFFQGLNDKNVSAASVMAFETWNLNRLDKNEPRLKISSRYYLSDHSLNMSMTNDLIMIMEAYLKP